MRTSIWPMFVLACSCGREAARDCGPAPAPDHQSTVRVTMDHVLDGRYRLAQPSDYRFAAPVQGRVARWLFEPQVDGRSHQLGYVHGWQVDFWVTPHYEGYPPQPEAHKMAFFIGGQLRGLFWEGEENSPLDLAKWTRDWVDPTWSLERDAKPARPPR